MQPGRVLRIDGDHLVAGCRILCDLFGLLGMGRNLDLPVGVDPDQIPMAGPIELGVELEIVPRAQRSQARLVRLLAVGKRIAFDSLIVAVATDEEGRTLNGYRFGRESRRRR